MVELRDGYVVDLTYATKAYAELSPPCLSLMTMMSGHSPPATTAPDYLELGFGQGLSLNIAAAANAGVYRGIDFIPAHVDWAAGLAAQSGADLTVTGQSMIEFAAEPGGEDFDYITLHGVWSWVDDAARAAIARILGKRLRPGGVALISYNTPAGWAALEPLRQLFLRYSAASGLPPAEAMAGAIDYAAKLAKLDGAYFRDNPVVSAELEKLKGGDPNYLVHEYLNEGHRVLSFADTAAFLADAGLTYIGPSRFGEFLDRRRTSAEAMALAEEVGDLRLTEMTRDVMQALRFRSDLYMKGPPRPLAGDGDSLVSRRFVLVGEGETPPEVEFGKAPGFQKLVDNVFAKLAEDGASPKSLADLIRHCGDYPADRVGWALMSLCSRSAAAPARDTAEAAAVAPQAQALNRALVAETFAGRQVPALASPLTGGGAAAGLLPQMFLHARNERAPDETAYVWEGLKAMGRAMSKDGEAVQGEAENIALLRTHAPTRESPEIDRLLRLGVIPDALANPI